MATRVFDGTKFFENDLPKNIPAKFGPNWPSGLGNVLSIVVPHDARPTTHDRHNMILTLTRVRCAQMSLNGGSFDTCTLFHRPWLTWYSISLKIGLINNNNLYLGKTNL